MKKITFLLLLFSTVTFAQIPFQQLSIEPSYSLASYSMKSINEHFIESYAQKFNLLDKTIHSGQQFGLNLNYRVNGLFNVGVYGMYQFGKSNGKNIMTYTDDFGNPTQTVECNCYELKTESLGTGISSTWYISYLLGFQDKDSSFLSKTHLGIDFNVGMAFSKAIIDTRFQNFTDASNYDFFNSQDFQGQIGVRFEYEFAQKPFISSVGIKTGYNYLRTKKLKDRLGQDWIVADEKPIHLDFSGFYFGVFLKIGR